jgi:uncharacterized protein (TIGR02246 family)
MNIMNAQATLTAALEDIHPRFQTAFNTKNLNGIVALYEPDAVFINIDGTVLHGQEEIRKAYRQLFSGDLQIRLETAGIFESTTGVALMHAKWELHGFGPAGEKIERHGTSAEVVRLQANGSWLYTIDNPSVPFAS